MEISLSYEEVLNYHHNLLESIIESFKKILDDNQINIKNITWSYSYYSQINSNSYLHKIIEDVMNNSNSLSKENYIKSSLINIKDIYLKANYEDNEISLKVNKHTDIFIIKFSELAGDNFDDIRELEKEIESVPLCEISHSMKMDYWNPSNFEENDVDFELNDVLDKISNIGIKGLTKNELLFLEKQTELKRNKTK